MTGGSISHPGLLWNAAGGDTLSDWVKQQKTPSAPWSPPREDARKAPRNGGKPAAAAAALQAKQAKAAAKGAAAKGAAKAAAPAKPDPKQWGDPKAMSVTIRRIREDMENVEKTVPKERVAALFARFKDQAGDIEGWSKEINKGFTSVLTERDQLYPLLIKDGYFTKAQLKAASKVLFESVKEVASPKPGGKAAGGAKAATLGDTEPDRAGDSAKRQKVGDRDESQAQLVATLSDAIKMCRGDGGPQEQRPDLVSGDLARRLDRIDEALLAKDDVSELKERVSELKDRIHQLEQTKSASAQHISGLQSDVKELTVLLAAMCGAAACNEQLRPVFAGLVKMLVLGKMGDMQDTTQAAWSKITAGLAAELKVELSSLILSM